MSRLAIVAVLSALILSIGGNVGAAVLITSADIENDTIRSVDVRDDTIRSVDVTDETIRGVDVQNGSLAGGDLADGSVTRADLASGAGAGCCSISFFEYQVPANDCHTRAIGFPEADLGEVLLTYPAGADLGTGVYFRPTVVAHPGEGLIETCNSTGAPVTIPFGTFFSLRLIG